MIEIVRAKAERAKQPWHVRVRGRGNSEPLVWGENLVDLDAVGVELAALGREFSPVDRAEYHGNETGGVLAVWLDEDDQGEKVGIPVEVVDLRQVAEPQAVEEPGGKPDWIGEKDEPEKPAKKTAKKAAADA